MLKALELSACKSGLFIVQVLNVIVFGYMNDKTCIQFLFVIRAKSCVAIEHNFLIRFVIHNNQGPLRPDGEQ
jgi:hypothetical protein